MSTTESAPEHPALTSDEDELEEWFALVDLYRRLHSPGATYGTRCDEEGTPDE